MGDKNRCRKASEEAVILMHKRDDSGLDQGGRSGIGIGQDSLNSTFILMVELEQFADKLDVNLKRKKK